MTEPAVHTDEAGLTRRQLLIGGGVALGALAVGGVVAQRTLPLRSCYDRLMGLCGPDGPVPPDRASPTYGVFRSRILGEGVEYGFWVPTARVPYGYRFPVVYCLPGRSRGPRYVLDGPLYMADFAAAAPKGGGAPMLALVSLFGSDTYWHRRASGEDRMAMLLDEFIPWFEREHQVGGARERRAIMGWSMGGYGAILAAEKRSGMFAALCAVSPALWYRWEDSGDAFDSEQDYQANDVFTRAGALWKVATRIDCGRADVFYGAARDFATTCQGFGGAVVQGDVIGPGFEKGCHDPGFWRRVAPREIDFLTAALAKAEAKASRS